MLTPITVTWSVVNPDNSLPTGGMLFQLVDAEGNVCGLQDSSSGESTTGLTIAASLVSGKLLANPVGGGGYGPLVLLANDDPTTEPVGTSYLVTESLPQSLQLPPWNLTVPHTASGGMLNLGTLRPAFT